MNNNLTKLNQNSKLALLKSKSLLDTTKNLINQKRYNNLICHKKNDLYYILVNIQFERRFEIYDKNFIKLFEFKNVTKVEFIDFSSNLKYFITYSYEGIVIIYDTNFNIIYEIDNENFRNIYQEELIIVTQKDNSVIVRDLKTFSIIHKIDNENFQSIYQENSIVVTQKDDSVIVRDLKTFSIKKVFETKKVYVFTHYMIVIKEESMTLWNIDEFTLILEFERNEYIKYINDIYLTADNKYLICNSSNFFNSMSYILKWSINGNFIKTFISQSIYKKSRRDAFNQKLELKGILFNDFAIVDYDNICEGQYHTLINLESYNKVYYYKESGSYINHSEKFIISKSYNSNKQNYYIEIFDIKTNEVINFDTEKNPEYKVSIDELFLILSIENFKLKVFNFLTKQSYDIEINKSVLSFLFVSDNNTVMVLTKDLELLQIDYHSGVVIKTWKDINFTNNVVELTKLSDDNLFLTVLEKKDYFSEFSLWNLDTNVCLGSSFKQVDFLKSS